MATSIHLPAPLLQELDRRAQALHISRNRLIVRAIERELAQELDWSEGFFERLSAIDPETAELLDHSVTEVQRLRTYCCSSVSGVYPAGSS